MARLMAMFGDRKPAAEAKQLEERIDAVDQRLNLEAERRRRGLDARVAAQRAAQQR